MWLYTRIMRPKMQSVDPDQIAQGAVWSGLHCLPRPVRLKTQDHYGNILVGI